MKNGHKHIVKLSNEEYKQLQRITRSGKHNARVIKRAHILLKAHTGYIDKDIAEHAGVSKRTVERIGKNYIEGGLDRALYDAPRPGKSPIITPKVEAHLVAIACTPPPEGAVRWTLELLRERLIDDKMVTRISLNAIHEHLSNRGIKPWREKNVVHSRD
jgi:transposase